jgi:hypothetical protein
MTRPPKLVQPCESPRPNGRGDSWRTKRHPPEQIVRKPRGREVAGGGHTRRPVLLVCVTRCMGQFPRSSSSCYAASPRSSNYHPPSQTNTPSPTRQNRRAPPRRKHHRRDPHNRHPGRWLKQPVLAAIRQICPPSAHRALSSVGYEGQSWLGWARVGAVRELVRVELIEGVDDGRVELAAA